MTIKEIIRYLDGDFSLSKKRAIEQKILKNPELIEDVGRLIRIKKRLPKNEKLEDHLSKRAEQIRKNFFL